MKKGFTLIEVLAVITVLSLLMVLLIPKITDVVNNQNAKLRQQTIASIERAAYNYATENSQTLGYTSITHTVTLDDLKTSGYLDGSDIIDPVTDDELTGYITIKWENNDYKVTYVE